MKRIIKTTDEQEAYSKSRKVHMYLARAGVVKKIKRATHKRERRETQHWIDDSND